MKRLLAGMFYAVFGCPHEWGWPRVVRVSADQTRHYQACVKCGRIRLYDWQEMKGLGRV